MQPGEGRAATTGGRRPGRFQRRTGSCFASRRSTNPFGCWVGIGGYRGGIFRKRAGLRARKVAVFAVRRPDTVAVLAIRRAPRQRPFPSGTQPGSGLCHRWVARWRSVNAVGCFRSARNPAAALPIRHATRQRSLPSGTQPASGPCHPARNPPAVLAIGHATRQRPLPSGGQPGRGLSRPARNPPAVFAVGRAARSRSLPSGGQPGRGPCRRAGSPVAVLAVGRVARWGSVNAVGCFRSD